MSITRRQAVGGLAAIPVAASASAYAASTRYDVIVVGAGVFGAWTAEMLRREGKRVLLVDAWAPAHARASSGGESRMTRGAYGPDEIYTRMAWDSLPEWKALSAKAGLPIFHNLGVLFWFAGEEPYATSSVDIHKKLGLPIEWIAAKGLRKRWPQIDWTGVSAGIYEPEFGALMARRSVETLVAEFVRDGGAYKQAAILPPKTGKALTEIRTAAGDRLKAEKFVFACGPWLAKLFPELLAERLFVTRQEIFFFTPPSGDTRFSAPALPGWADLNAGEFYYGFPVLEGRGFKVANDKHGDPVDPDAEDRTPSASGLADARAYVAKRFPALAGAKLSESRVCQYENSANGDFLIDRHPDWANTVLIGMGSGHGFKHGPAVGKFAAGLVLGDAAAEPRFTLASKATRQDRAVH